MAKSTPTRTCAQGAECSAGPGPQPADAFKADPTCAGGRRKTCKACENARRRDWRAGGDLETLRTCIPFGSALQRQAAEAMLEHGSLAAAAEALGMSTRLLRGMLSELKRAAARRGHAPAEDMTSVVPEGFHVKGVSGYYRVNPDGTRELTGQWVKTKADEEHALEMLAVAVERIAEPFAAVAKPVKTPKVNDADLLAVYPMGDPHLGMHAWAAECGQSFDLKIAEANLVAAVDRLVDLAPAAEQALIISLGDMFHADNARSTTTAGTYVDTDTRYPKVLQVGVRAMIRCIDQALLKHRKVRVICASGNHDELTSMAMSLCLSSFYSREPRVDVDISPDAFRWHRFGKCLLGVAHGDDVKLADLPGVMAVDRQEDWGATSHRYFYTGHIHHETVKEFPGVTVESFRTLAPRDKWHSKKGYRSGQDMRLHVWHREHGKILEHSVGIQQVIAAAAKVRP